MTDEDYDDDEANEVLQRVKRLTKIVMDQQNVSAEEALHDTLVLDSEMQSQAKNDPHAYLTKMLKQDIDKALDFIQSKQYRENIEKEKDVVRAVLHQMPHNEYF